MPDEERCLFYLVHTIADIVDGSEHWDVYRIRGDDLETIELVAEFMEPFLPLAIDYLNRMNLDQWRMEP